MRILNLEFNRIMILDENLFIYTPELEEFSATMNQIEILHRDLFIECHKLRKISLGGNSLMHIEVDFFRISSIKEIDLRHNDCINLKVESDANRLKFKQHIAVNCTGSSGRSYQDYYDDDE